MMMIGFIYEMDWKANASVVEFYLGLVNHNPSCYVFFPICYVYIFFFTFHSVVNLKGFPDSLTTKEIGKNTSLEKSLNRASKT